MPDVADAFLSRLFAANPRQEKKLTAFFEHTPEARRALADFLSLYQPVWEKPEIGGIPGLCDAYMQLIGEMMRCRMDFTRTGTYATVSQADAAERVYHNAAQMLPYMLGLAVSQYLWPAHFRLLQFYARCVKQQPRTGRFLEVGSGHGIFSQYLERHIAPGAGIDIVDISPVSIALSRDLLAATCGPGLGRIRFTQSDIADYTADRPYDFIVMGEVLEHVEAPDSILHALHRLLAPGGSLYITTCANCPTIDHIYHFHNVEEIRALVRKCNFNIMEEVVAPSEDKPLEYHEKHKLDILYGALLRKA